MNLKFPLDYEEYKEIPMPIQLLILETQLIDKAMLNYKGNKTHAAASLGIHRTTLVMKLKQRATAKANASNGKPVGDQSNEK